MSSTPKNKDSKPTTPPKTTGWTQALFGTTWLSSKKTSHVESSTKSTALKQQPSPKPFQNLEGFNTVHSPDLGTSGAFATTSDSAPRAASVLPIRQLQQTRPSASGSGTQKSAVPSKSPWKAPLMGATNGAGFNVGNLKPSSSRAVTTRNNGGNYFVSTTTRVVPESLDRLRKIRRPNKYKGSGVFAVRRNNRGKKRMIDKDALNELLINTRPEIEAPRQKIESDRNIRTAFTNRVCRMGRRIHTSDRGRRYDRLPNQQQLSNDDTKFISNGKRDIERDDDQKNTEAAMSKRRKVKSVSLPIENLVATPSKDRDSRSSKRKATPYKTSMYTIDDDSDGEDKSTPTSNRKLYKLKRSPSSKQSDPKPGTSNAQGIEEFPVKPSTYEVIVEDFSSWPKDLEISAPIKSNKIITEKFMAYFRQTFEANLCSSIRNRPPQFQQKPLIKGPKKDRTVQDYNDDSDHDETGQNAKRSRTAFWKCSTCGFDNDDEETRCQKFILKDGASKKSLCNEGRSVMLKLNWGNKFDHLSKGKVQCTVCYVWNDKSRTTCVSCESPLPHVQNSNAGNSQTSAAKSEKTPALDGSIGSQGFSFGGATAGEKSSTGFSFGNSASVGAPAPSASSSALTNSGFQFGAQTNVKSPSVTATSAANGTTASGIFQFGSGATPNSSSLTTSSAARGTTKTSAVTGGFKFAAPAEEKSPARATTSVPGSGTESSGFRFGATAESKSPSLTTTAAPSPSPTPAAKSTQKPFSFGSSNAAPAPSHSVGVKPAPSPSTSTNSGSQLFGNFASSSTPGSSATKAPKFTFGTKKDIMSTSKEEAAKVSPTEPATKRKNTDCDKKGFGFPSSSTKDNVSEKRAPSFSFGSGAVDASTTAKPTTPGFSFGSSSATNSTAPSATAPKFSFGTAGGPSSRSSGAAMPSLGSVATEGNNDNDSKKKRSRNDPITSLGSKSSSEASSLSKGASASASTQAGAPAPFVFGMSSTNSAKENNPAINAPGFGSSNALSSFGNASNSSVTPSVTQALTPAPSFGSAPAPAASISFGSTSAPAPTPTAPFSFGSTPALAPPQAAPFSFGSTSAAPTFGSTASAPAVPTFGSAAPTPAAPTFGSTAPALAAPTFGTTANAPAAPMTFGSTPAQGPSSGFGSTHASSNAMNFGSTTLAQSTTFGSTPAAIPAPFGAAAPMPFGSSTSATVPFGSTTAAPSQPFGNNTASSFGTGQPSAVAAPMAFGGNPAPGGFGVGGFGQQATQQQPSAPPNAGFSLGTGGGAPRGRTPGRGRRRVIKAKRPT